MKSTPVHNNFNPDLLKLIPVNSTSIIEIGCSSGALARVFKKISPNCWYVGVDVVPDFLDLASDYCDETLCLNIENANDEFYQTNSSADCWVFGDALEHLIDPWATVSKIRKNIKNKACLVASIPNAQHWSLQVRLNAGIFEYENSGLLDRTHLRWFTRKTMINFFRDVGFEIESGYPRIFNEPQREKYLPLIAQMAIASNVDPEDAVNDALPLQYVVRCRPV